MQTSKHKIIILLGPTACGKTSFAVQIANRIHAAILSADSRQIYQGLDIGTGKDLADYTLSDGTKIPYYLIDIVQPNEEYSLAHYIKDASNALMEVEKTGYIPLFVGGTALYLHAIVSNYHLKHGAPCNKLREKLRVMSSGELCAELLRLEPGSVIPLREPDNRTRLIRAIELAMSAQEPPSAQDVDTCNELEIPFPESDFLILGLYRTRQENRGRILERLNDRLNHGMLEEIKQLHQNGMSWERMDFLGLEYRYLSRYLRNEITFDEMKEQLYAKICQFSKRQDSWFRHFEKDGFPIHWLKPDEIDKAVSLCDAFLADKEIPVPTFKLSECKYPIH